MNQHELENMTVVALKRELKARNLPMTGNKNDLVQRLSVHLSSGGIQMDLQGVGFNVNLLHDAIPEASSFGDPTKIFTTIEAELATDTIKPAVPDVTTAAKPAGESLKSALNVQNITSVVMPEKPVNNENLHNEKGSAESLTEKSDTQSALTESERKILRAKKFNIAVVQTKEMRAERFGLTQQGSSKNHDSVADTVSSEVLKKRAERFGIPLTTPTAAAGPAKVIDDPLAAEKLKQRSLRFGLNMSSPDVNKKVSSDSETSKVTDNKQSEAILKRKERFGNTLTSNTASQDSVDVKKRMRAERFGVKT